MANSKVMHIINDSGLISIRRPYNPAVALTQVHPVRYNASRHFMDHERSPFLEHVLGDERYVQFTAHASGQEALDEVTNWLGSSARRGRLLETGKYDPLAGRYQVETWKFLYGHYTDHGSLFMLPADSHLNSLDDLGIHVIDPQKAPKYFKRVAAPYQYSVFGTINSIHEDEFGTVCEFELDNGYVGTHRNIELDRLPSDLHRAVSDGVMLLKASFLVDQVGVKDRNINTYGCKPTVFDPLGTGKGFGHVHPGLQFDIVTYGAKKQLVFDEFFFGILGSLKPGEVFRSDLQSMTNFEEYEYALDGARRLMKEVTEALGNPELMRGLFLSRLKQVSKVADDPSATEQWMLINALEAGYDIEMEPGLFRRCYNHLMHEVMNCEKGRIPFDHLGTRADVCPDPAMFDEYGDIHPENSIIPEGTCVAMDVPQGPIVAYRQPNGMAMEHSQSVNFHMRQFERYIGRKRIFYGQDLPVILEPMNGADLDDTLCVIHDPAAVKHIRSLSYPVTDKMDIEVVRKKGLGRYYDAMKRTVENLDTASYTVQNFIDSMQVARSSKVKLGQVVNTIMLDTLLSGKHKANMMDYLAELIQNEPDKDRKIWYLERREWLANREDYQLRYIATNLEAVIDFCVQGKGNPRQFDQMVKQVNDMKAETEVFPMIFAKQGTGFMGQGRISAKKQLGIDYVLAPSLLCAALKEVEEERNILLNDLRAHEWDCISYVPDEVENQFGSSRDITRIARDIRSWFNTRIVAAMSINNAQMKREAYNHVMYGHFHNCLVGVCPSPCPNKGKLIEDGLVQRMEEFDLETRQFIAVEMKRLVHHNPSQDRVNEDGTYRGVPDGVFANNVMFNYYLSALDECGLTGKYVQVELDNVSISKHVKDNSFMVVVENSVVTRKSDEFWIGTVSAPDGEYKCINGMLELRAPNPAITSESRYEFANDYSNAREIEQI